MNETASTFPSPMRIVLVDDHPGMRAGLRAAIERQSDMHVVAEFASWRECLAHVRCNAPDVIVLDLNLTDGSGWSLLEQLRALGRPPPTLVVSVCDESVYARRILRAGARGYLTKDAPLDQVVLAIREVREGRLAASPVLMQQLAAEALGLGEAPDGGGEAAAGLSDRELQVFGLLARELSGKEIAVQLGVSQKTVSTYKIRLMAKLGVRTTPELIARYQADSRGGV